MAPCRPMAAGRTVTEMLTREELVALARRWLGLWSAPTDWRLFDDLHADDFEDCSPAGRDHSKQAFAAALAAFLDAFPDVRIQVDDVVVDLETERVAVRWSAVGTNAARYLGVGPTGRRTRITGIEIIAIQAGRVARRWGEWDISDHR